MEWRLKWLILRRCYDKKNSATAATRASGLPYNEVCDYYWTRGHIENGGINRGWLNQSLHQIKRDKLWRVVERCYNMRSISPKLATAGTGLPFREVHHYFVTRDAITLGAKSLIR